MRRIVSVAFYVLFSYFMASVCFAKCCSCEAPDGSCSADICCPVGCIAGCGNHGACWAECLQMGPQLLNEEVSLAIENANSAQVAESLSRVLGKEVRYEVADNSKRFNFKYEHVPFKVVLDRIAREGRITVSGSTTKCTDSSVPAFLLDQRVNLDLTLKSADVVSQAITSRIGVQVTIIPEDSNSLLCVHAKGTPLRRVLRSLSRVGRIVVAGQEFACRKDSVAR